MTLEDINQQLDNGLRVFQHYLGGTIQLNKHYKSPFGHEGRPCFHLYRRERDGVICFKDFAFDEFQGSCYDFVGKLFNEDFKGALHIIKRDVLGLSGRDLESGLNSKPSNAALRANFRPLAKQAQQQNETVHIKGFPREWTSDDLVFFGKTGIAQATLQKYHCYPLSSYVFAKGDKHFTITSKPDDPMYGYHFPATDHWKIYRPFTADKRFRWISNVVQGLDVFGWDALPARASKLYLCAGQRDTMALHELTGLPCLALNSETAKLTPELHQLLLCVADEVYCCLDNDKTGHEAQQKMRYEWGIYDAGRQVLESAELNDLSEVLAECGDLQREELATHFRDFSVHKLSV